MDEWERRARERERERRWEEHRQLHEEENRLQEEENRLREEENRLQEEENALLWEQAEREEEERRRQADEQNYQAACPACKWCGGRYNFYNSGYFEYCSKRCAINDLGKNAIAAYASDTGPRNLSMKLDQLISQHNALAALVLADGIKKLTTKQNLFLAKEYTTDHSCITLNLKKAFSFLESAFNTLDSTGKAEMIIHLITEGDNKYAYRDGLNMGAQLLYAESEKPDFNINEFLTLKQQLLLAKVFSDEKNNFGLSSSAKEDCFKKFVLDCIGNNLYSLDTFDKQKKMIFDCFQSKKYLNGFQHQVGFHFASMVFDGYGNQDVDFTDQICDLRENMTDGDLKKCKSYCDSKFLQLLVEYEMTVRKNIALADKKVDTDTDRAIYKLLGVIFIAVTIWYCCFMSYLFWKIVAGVILLLCGGLIISSSGENRKLEFSQQAREEQRKNIHSCNNLADLKKTMK